MLSFRRAASPRTTSTGSCGHSITPSIATITLIETQPMSGDWPMRPTRPDGVPVGVPFGVEITQAEKRAVLQNDLAARPPQNPHGPLVGTNPDDATTYFQI